MQFGEEKTAAQREYVWNDWNFVSATLSGCESCMETGALDRASHDPEIKQENAE